MRTLKKLFSLGLMFIMLFSVFACKGEYNYATGGGNNNANSDMPPPPELDDDPTNDFTVTLRVNGEAYSPRMDMYVRWSDVDGFSVFTAPFDKDGVARIDGLNGDYKVTLSSVPNEYTYDPNSYIATNNARNIVIDLYTLNRLTGSGTGIYDCYQFSKTGVYCAVIEDPDDAIYFQYAPDRSGTYTIESWADTTADNINPYIEVYGGHSQYKYYIRTINDGGTMGSYTINFVHNVQIADENISSGGGQAVYTFAIKADTKNNKYPITLTFAVKRDGDFELGGNVDAGWKGIVVPQYDFSKYYEKTTHEYTGKTKKYPEYQYSAGSNIYVFDDDKFALWDIEKGGDGFYHVYDKQKYAETDGYGPILYANITTACRFIDKAFTEIEYGQEAMGGETVIVNSALKMNGKNYKHFIEGHTKLTKFRYYCVDTCTCHTSDNIWACDANCMNCTSNCRRCPKELIGHEGYQAYANSAGMVAVTQELRDFLVAYCEKQMFFYDGQGGLENTVINGKQFQAVGDSGWLFACAYYE